MRWLIWSLLMLLLALPACTPNSQLPGPTKQTVIQMLTAYPAQSQQKQQPLLSEPDDVTLITFTALDTKEQVLTYYDTNLRALGFQEVENNFGTLDADKSYEVGDCPLQTVAIEINDNTLEVMVEYVFALCR